VLVAADAAESPLRFKPRSLKMAEESAKGSKSKIGRSPSFDTLLISGLDSPKSYVSRGYQWRFRAMIQANMRAP
jgi:hypothetical protein